MRSHRRAVVVAIVVAVGVALIASAAALRSSRADHATQLRPPNHLTVNGNAWALGVDPDHLWFAWQLHDGRPGARQTAYRIVVSKRPHPLPDHRGVVWDHAVRSGQQAFVPYDGPTLLSSRTYYWSVQATTIATGPDGAARASEFAGGPTVRDRPARHGLEGELDSTRARASRRRGVHLRPQGRESAQLLHRVGAGVRGRVAAVPAVHRRQASRFAGRRTRTPTTPTTRRSTSTSLLQPGKPNVIGVLHYWSGPGQGQSGRHPRVAGPDRGRARQRHARGDRDRRDLARAQGGVARRAASERRGRLRRAHRRAAVTRPIGPRRRSTTARWQRVAVIGPPGTKPFTHLVAQRTRIGDQLVHPVSVKKLPDGAIVADYGTVIAARPSVQFRDGVAGRRIRMHVGFVLDPDGHVSTTTGTQATDLSFEYIERDGLQVFEPFTYLGFRYLEIDAPGETMQAAQLGAARSPREDARRARGDVHVVGSDARQGLGARAPLRVVRVAGPVRRHPDPGEGPVPRRRLQHLAGDDARVRRAEPHLAGAARLRRFPTSVLAQRQPQRGVPERRRPALLPRLHRALSRLGLAVLRGDGRPRHARAALSGGAPGGRTTSRR